MRQKGPIRLQWSGITRRDSPEENSIRYQNGNWLSDWALSRILTCRQGVEDRLTLQEDRQQNPEKEVEWACLTMCRWPRVGQVLSGGKGVSCGPWGVNPAGWGLGCGLWSQMQIWTLMLEIVGSWEHLRTAASQPSICWGTGKVCEQVALKV